MGANKSPSRVTDGPYAGWAVNDEEAQISIANGGIVRLGQPFCIDVTQLGPDANVPNNGVALPQCERVVATTSANAGPVFGVLVDIPGAPTGLTKSIISGVPAWTNTSGSTLLTTIKLRQFGFGQVWAGTTAIGQTGGHSILVGSQIIVTSAQAFGIQGTLALSQCIGIALATAINATEVGAPLGPGVVSVNPTSMVGIVPGTILLIDTLASGVQETVSCGSISIPFINIALANAHPSGFKITGPATNPAINSLLISTPGAGVTYANLVSCFINIT